MKPARYQPLVTSHLKKNGSGVMSKPNKVQIRSSSAEFLQNIFATGELDEKAVCRDFRHTAEDGKEYLTAFYNLDAIIAVVSAPSFRLQGRGRSLSEA
jgi:hypothetical protein